MTCLTTDNKIDMKSSTYYLSGVGRHTPDHHPL